MSVLNARAHTAIYSVDVSQKAPMNSKLWTPGDIKRRDPKSQRQWAGSEGLSTIRNQLSASVTLVTLVGRG